MAQSSSSAGGQKLSDGLWGVETSYLCAAFVIENGKVTHCAPILRKRLAYWMTIAKRIDSAPRRLRGLR
jgi:hypothetical protein